MNFYTPSEDSYLLCKVVKNYLKINNKEDISKIKVLDLGTGSGIQSKNLIDFKIKKENIFVSDINEEALKEAKKLGIKVIKSDLFSNIKERYDVIIFNPPYLPENKYCNEIDVTGGKKGDETIIKFIKNLKKHLTKNGVCFLLTSSLTPEKKWKNEAEKQKLKLKKVAEQKLFFERLFIWEIKSSQ